MEQLVEIKTRPKSIAVDVSSREIVAEFEGFAAVFAADHFFTLE